MFLLVHTRSGPDQVCVQRRRWNSSGTVHRGALMKATTSFRLGPTLGLGLRMGERPKPRPKSFLKTASSHHLKKGHLDGSAISPGCMPLSEPAARERVSRPPSTGFADDAVPQRRAVGFLLIDSLRRPIYANAEAARILLYPAKPDNSFLELLPENKIRVMLPQNNGVPQVDLQTVFLSVRRHYLCRAFHFGARSTGSCEANTALVLERIVPGGLHPSEIAQKFGLTPREQETTELLMLGLSSKEIASRMSISPNTVKAFLRVIMVKMGVTSRSGVVGKILAHAVGEELKVS